MQLLKVPVNNVDLKEEIGNERLFSLFSSKSSVCQRGLFSDLKEKKSGETKAGKTLSCLTCWC